MYEGNHGSSVTILRNSGLRIIGEKVGWVGMVFFSLIIVYLFWAMLDSPLIGIGLGSIILSLVLIYLFRSFQPKGIEFHHTGLLVSYPLGKKRVVYDDIVIMRQIGGPRDGKLFVHLKNGDEVFLWFLSKEFYEETIRRICAARPDLVKETTTEDLLRRVQWALEDSEHEHEGERFWSERWSDSLSYKYYSWGRRPKRTQDV